MPLLLYAAFKLFYMHHTLLYKLKLPFVDFTNLNEEFYECLKTRMQHFMIDFIGLFKAGGRELQYHTSVIFRDSYLNIRTLQACKQIRIGGKFFF